MEIRIDPEFQSKIPPLTEYEFKQLEENILEAGEIYEPIVTWNGIIVDGHNRYKIHKDHPEISIRTREMEFQDKWEAFDWMYKNQLGRRNLTEEQVTYIRGKLYEARKHTHGGPRGNQYTTDLPRNQNDFLANLPKNNVIAREIADELGVGSATIQRSEKYAQGIDTIRESDPELADKILTSGKKVKKSVVMSVAKAKPDEQKEIVKAIRRSATDKEIDEIINSLTDETPFEYTIDNLVEQIRCNAGAFIRMLSNMIMDHKDLCNENTQVVISEIDRSLTTRINQIKERLEDESLL